MVGVEILQKRQPHHLPGYTGYCPQNRFVCGDHFGKATHELLLDPTVNHAEKLALIDNTKDYEVVRPTRRDINVVNSRAYKKTPVYRHPMLSSYDGFIPNLDGLRDKPFVAQATQGIADFERQQLIQKASSDCFKKMSKLQRGIEPMNNSEEYLLLQSKFRLPLTELRPQRAGLDRNYFVDEEHDKSKDCNTSPYFMENTNPRKYFISGYTGYVPNSHIHFGKSFKKLSADGLRDFTVDYLNKKRQEWNPLTISCEKQEICNIPMKTYQIHLKDTPLMPSYTGHVPGAKYKIGETYGYTSKGINQYIQDQLSFLNVKKCYSKNK